jgi:hypothetical protein
MPMHIGVSVNDFVLVQGLRDTRATLDGWNRDPWGVLREWLGLSVLIAVLLLWSVYAVAKLSTADPTRLALPGVTRPGTLADVGHVLYRNSLVLALHAMACVAGFIAGSSLPHSAARRTGFSRWLHEKAGPLAIAFVIGATLFSLSTQAYALGGAAASLAPQLGTTPGVLLLGLVPHALPELVALFLPLAAWTIASRRNEWHELLAATFVTVALAAPVILASAFVEVYLSPRLLIALIG